VVHPYFHFFILISWLDCAGPVPAKALDNLSTNNRGAHTSRILQDHFFSHRFGSTVNDPRPYLRHGKKVLPCQKEHILPANFQMAANTKTRASLGRACSRLMRPVTAGTAAAEEIKRIRYNFDITEGEIS